MIYSILVAVQVVVALSLIGIILVQHGKGADAGAAFGSGASGTVFGAKGSANFLTHATAALAVIFFAISLTLAYLVNGASAPSGSITDQAQQRPPAGASLITDKNNNGVPGDEVLSGDQSSPAGAGAPAKTAAPDKKAPAGATGSGASGGGTSGFGTKRGGTSGNGDTSAQVPN